MLYLRAQNLIYIFRVKYGITIFAKIEEMSTIQLKKIKIYAFHGCLDEETKIGSEYIVTLWVNANLENAAKSDELKDTVDYVELMRIVKKEMAINSKLLEHVAKRIIDSLFYEIPLLNYVKVMVAKVNPPIGGEVDAVSVTLKSIR